MKNDRHKFEYAISACLLGIPCRWNGTSKANKKALKIFMKGKAVSVCPELLGGLGVPRPACEIIGGNGADVLSGKANVCDKKGNNLSKEFVRGSKMAFENVIKKYGIKKAILKSGSPACGVKCVYSGNFDGKKKKGMGIFTAMLKKNGVSVSEEIE